MKIKIENDNLINILLMIWTISLLISLLINVTTGYISQSFIILYIIISIIIASIFFIIIVLKESIIK